MNRTILIASICFLTAQSVDAQTKPSIPLIQPNSIVIAKLTALDDAVNDFNEITAEHAIGQDQTPLVSTEVSGAIH